MVDVACVYVVSGWVSVSEAGSWVGESSVADANMVSGSEPGMGMIVQEGSLSLFGEVGAVSWRAEWGSTCTMASSGQSGS